MESRDSFLRVLVSKVSGLMTLNIIKKWLSKTSIIQRVFACCIFRLETTKTGRKNARNLKKFNFEVMTASNFEGSSLGLEFEVSRLGIFDKV